MDQLGSVAKKESTGGTSRGKSTRRSLQVKRRANQRGKPVMNGDQVLLNVLNELKIEIGYPFELVNFEKGNGEMTAAIFLTGKVWTPNCKLKRKDEASA